MSQLPTDLLNSLEGVFGFEKESFCQIHEQTLDLTSIRLNFSKLSDFEIPSGWQKIPWSTSGYYLPERPAFTLDPIFHAGAYYVQEASSMFLEKVLKHTINPGTEIKALDLCAAPGGKSTLIQSFLGERDVLVSNEVIKSRANILCENIVKWGAKNVVVTNNDPRDFQKVEDFFDLIVVDAPCSGSGLFRRDPEAIKEWSLENVKLCKERQQRILADILPSLNGDGVLIYSTCSYSSAENEEITDWLIDNFDLETIRIPIEIDWGILETLGESKAFGYRFYPDKVKGEGFFISAFRKKGEKKEYVHKGRYKSNFLEVSKKEKLLLSKFLKEGDYELVKFGNEYIRLTSETFEAIYVFQQLYIKQIGVRIGELVREDLIPNHQGLMADIWIENLYPKLELEEHGALDFLRKKEFQLESNLKGWTIFTYKNIALGFVKLLGNRMNNYYPKEWRILHL